MLNKAIFLDRDGTINVEKNYLYRFEDWEWIDGAVDAIRGFNELGYYVIVISNQAGIARGLYTTEDVNRLHAFVDDLLKPYGARIDAYYYCKHHPKFGEIRTCNCRKPLPGMLFQAQQDFSIDMAGSYMIGDKSSDLLAGHNAGTKSILVETGYGMQEATTISSEIPIAKNLLDALSMITMKR